MPFRVMVNVSFLHRRKMPKIKTAIQAIRDSRNDSGWVADPCVTTDFSHRSHTSVRKCKPLVWNHQDTPHSLSAAKGLQKEAERVEAMDSNKKRPTQRVGLLHM